MNASLTTIKVRLPTGELKELNVQLPDKTTVIVHTMREAVKIVKFLAPGSTIILDEAISDSGRKLDDVDMKIINEIARRKSISLENFHENTFKRIKERIKNYDINSLYPKILKDCFEKRDKNVFI